MNTHLQVLSTGFVAIVAVWATWAVLSSKVRDGILGKVIYSTIAIAGYAMVIRGEWPYITPTVAGTTLYGGLACAGLRHIVVVMWWQRIKAWLCRHLNCEHCLADPRFGDEPGKTDRRRS